MLAGWPVCPRVPILVLMRAGDWAWWRPELRWITTPLPADQCKPGPLIGHRGPRLASDWMKDPRPGSPLGSSASISHTERADTNKNIVNTPHSRTWPQCRVFLLVYGGCWGLLMGWPDIDMRRSKGEGFKTCTGAATAQLGPHFRWDSRKLLFDWIKIISHMKWLGFKDGYLAGNLSTFLGIKSLIKKAKGVCWCVDIRQWDIWQWLTPLCLNRNCFQQDLWI